MQQSSPVFLLSFAQIGAASVFWFSALSASAAKLKTPLRHLMIVMEKSVMGDAVCFDLKCNRDLFNTDVVFSLTSFYESLLWSVSQKSISRLSHTGASSLT